MVINGPSSSSSNEAHIARSPTAEDMRIYSLRMACPRNGEMTHLVKASYCAYQSVRLQVLGQLGCVRLAYQTVRNISRACRLASIAGIAGDCSHLFCQEIVYLLQ